MVSLAPRSRLIENVLLIEGASHAGKFLLGNVLAGLADIEHYQYLGILEHIPYLVELGFMTRETGKAIICCQIDNFGYDLVVGRVCNVRHDDMSSIYQSPHLKEILQRSLNSRDGVLQEIKSAQHFFPFMAHETMPLIDIYFEAYPTIKIIRMERSPLDLAYAWYRNGWGRRFGTDPLDFSMSIQTREGGPVAPWFAHDWLDEYSNSSEMDRIIKSLSVILTKSRAKLNGLTTERRQRVHVVCFEHLLTGPDKEVDGLSNFLNKKALLEPLAVIKAKQRLPRPDPRLQRDEKLAEVTAKAGPSYLKTLLELEDAYTKQWKIEDTSINA